MTEKVEAEKARMRDIRAGSGTRWGGCRRGRCGRVLMLLGGRLSPS